MKICGVIAEYNPFHNGHLWQIQQIRQRLHSDVLIVVMAGNFVQRGEMAIVNKWSRTQMALDAGVDLVVELPFAGAVQPADLFAREAMLILQQLQVTDLVFGTENSTLDYQQLGQQVEQAMQTTHFLTDYHQTYATQFNQVLQDQLGLTLTEPNELLGVAYAQAAIKIKYPIRLVPFARHGKAQHDQLTLGRKFSSASAIRQAILQQRDYAMSLPDFVLSNLGTQFLDWNQVFIFLKYRILTSSLAELTQIYQMNEGLEYKFKQEIIKSSDFATFLYRIKSKRYTFSRLRRLCLYVLLNVTTEQMQEMWSQRYLQILGFNAIGQQHLHALRKQVSWPLITKVTQKLGNGSGRMAHAVQIDRFLTLFGQPEQNFGHQPLRK
ncbi:nucleotidyltransferase [Bombilactobacillus folatiphilus]|uniref:tRNA(Met) cytidine acetate ligase n=1 Tax=Bombilactobacillus folatiphilus TaxID=2923362 RepID=A0ABY4PA51_9LACO|nr:nucleotidyltransferase [Bombilactobacillus folatiphilus]UQS82547.1 nucleotidyltransferase [Bombilactobacillus folatiphilus]